MHIGERLKRLRNNNNISQISVCEGITSPSHYSNIESGRYEPSEDILVQLSERLHVPAAYLLNVYDESQKIKKLLSTMDGLLEKDLSLVENFLKQNQASFTYICSIKQEIQFYILNCYFHLKTMSVTKAKEFNSKISSYIKDFSLMESIGFPNSITFKYLYNLAFLKSYERQFKEGKNYYIQSLNYVPSQLDEGRIHFNLALCCFNMHDFYTGLDYCNKAKSIYMDIHQWKQTVETYLLSGLIYMELNDLDNAQKVLMKGLNLGEEKNLELQLTKIYHNIGTLYLKKSELTKSMEYFHISLKLKEKVDPTSLFITYLALLHTHLERGEINDFETIVKKAKEARNKSIEDDYFLMSIQAEKEKLVNNMEAYEKLMTECLHFFYEKKYWREILSHAKELSDHLYMNRKYKKAYYYLNMELEANIKIYKEKTI
ncbi:helix-turn-helix domain-containing protein [Evansella cellulosilytica]|uniref:Helix-turn-helix domain protein n=1 Tax=Evansella cellulosilytica (strain ATCC 21833 / DSM 2522 / FERM P-1141 / JCM 9156 / N-4) TaxID=649639 RepID=E6U013_EVAC2|nr:helix-turn-helix transcriptional regulator [Evansella cellulosilytica]ADU29017.1 helix-turn-helix domain protein [Evansella cellulosilytica DSM 2522]